MNAQHKKDLAKVQQDGRALQYIKNQAPEICLAAVKQNGWALRHVKQQIPELCLAAIKQDGWALIYVKDLHSIADDIDESTIVEGLKSDLQKVVIAYQKLIKIREANTIAKRVNEGVLPIVNLATKKARL